MRLHYSAYSAQGALGQVARNAQRRRRRPAVSARASACRRGAVRRGHAALRSGTAVQGCAREHLHIGVF